MTHKDKKKPAATRKQTKKIQNIPQRLKARFQKRIRKNVRMSRENINNLVAELLLWITMEPKLPNHRAVLSNKKMFFFQRLFFDRMIFLSSVKYAADNQKRDIDYIDFPNLGGNFTSSCWFSLNDSEAVRAAIYII